MLKPFLLSPRDGVTRGTSGAKRRSAKAAAEHGELAAFRDLFAAAPAELASAYGIRAETIRGALCIAIASQPDSAMWNRALGVGVDAPATEAGLDEIAAFFTGLGVEYGIPLYPQAEPPELASWLQERGLVQGYPWAKFERGRDDPPEADTELRVIRAAREQAWEFGNVVVRGYGTPDFFADLAAQLPERPGWQCFLAYAGDEPAATGALYSDGAVGWLGIGATVPTHRRKGAQNALLAARVRAGVEEGCSVLVTETGALQGGRPSNSYRNILRAGFEQAYVRSNYLSSPEADTSGTRV